MWFRAITLSSLLVLGLMWTNSAFSQTTVDRIAAMEKKIAVMETTIQRVLTGRRAVDRLLADAIVLTDQDCAVLGADWKRYEGMGGRFPLGAGGTKDARGEARTSIIGDEGGVYMHPLTVAEMPSHRHGFMGSEGPRSVDDWDNEHAHRAKRRTTDPTGGNQPHNNMPPYLVVNFCHKEAGSRD